MIIVFGSIGADLVTTVQDFPKAGETVVGTSFAQYSGGKGANQALAAARAGHCDDGALVHMYGAVGTDGFADSACALLVEGGVEMSGVQNKPGSTGIATIFVSAQGQNCIAVYAGANGLADAAHVPAQHLSAGTVVVMQHECPHEANMDLARRAREGGALVMLNAAPARPLSLSELCSIPVLIVNESEAAAVANQHGWPEEPEAFAVAAYKATGQDVIVTLGEAGVLAVIEGVKYQVSAPRVTVVDTTGAGDAFVGALAAKVESGMPLEAALVYGIAAGSLACTSKGAQGGLAYADAIERLASTLTLNSEPLA